MNGKLPPGWEMATLDDLGTWTGGGTPSKKVADYWGGDIPWVTPKDMKAPRLNGSQDRITAKAVQESSAKLVPAGSLAFVVRSGILEHTLPIALLKCDATINQDLKVLTPHADLNPEWLLYALLALAPMIRRECRKDGTTVASLDFPKLRRYPVPLPPRAEQDRIVEAVESAIAAVNDGERSLDAARSRALALAESAFEAAVDVQAEKRPLRELLREPLRNGHSAKAAQDGRGVRTLTLTAVTKREFIDAHTKITAADKQRVRDLWLEPGDILVQRSNTPELVGTAARYNGPRKWAIFPDLLIRVRTKDELLPEFLECFLRAPSTRRLIRGQAQGIAGSMPKISQGVIEGLRVPLPSVRRQEEIVSAIFDRVHAVDQSVRAITDAEADARRLRRALLHAAFSGRLVPQDPADEPASELLKRIEAEKAEREAELKAARRRTRKDRSGSSAETAEALPRPPSQSGKVRTSSD